MIKSKDMISFLKLYQDIGINLIVDNQKQGFDPKLIMHYKKSKTSSNKTLNIDLEIKKLEDNFKNLEGCNLRKTAVNFVPFQGSCDSRILIPTFILCIGETATNLTLKTNQSITKSRGRWHKLCLTTNDQKEIVLKVLPTLNITYLITRPDMKRQAWEDMKLLRDQIKEVRLC